MDSWSQTSHSHAPCSFLPSKPEKLDGVPRPRGHLTRSLAPPVARAWQRPDPRSLARRHLKKTRLENSLSHFREQSRFATRPPRIGLTPRSSDHLSAGPYMARSIKTISFTDPKQGGCEHLYCESHSQIPVPPVTNQ